MSSQGAHRAYQAGSEPKRRDLLSLIATAGAAIGLGAIAWPLIDFINPSADVVAGGAPIDIDLSEIEPGQQIVVLWRGAPILIVNRTPAALKTLQAPTLISLLSDPTSSAHRRPPLCGQLAPLDQADIRGVGRDLYPSWMPAGI